MIKLTHRQWEDILERIKEEYPVSVWAIRWRQKEVLGFTVRNGDHWRRIGIDKRGEAYFEREECIYLDFYNDAQETFFSLRYLNI